HSDIGWRGRLTPMHASVLPRAPAPPRCQKRLHGGDSTDTMPAPPGADERPCSDDAVTPREPRSVSLRPGSPRLSVDPTSGHRAQLSMRTSLLIGLALLAPCRGRPRPPGIIPAGPGGPLP